MSINASKTVRPREETQPPATIKFVIAFGELLLSQGLDEDDHMIAFGHLSTIAFGRNFDDHAHDQSWHG